MSVPTHCPPPQSLPSSPGAQHTHALASKFCFLSSPHVRSYVKIWLKKAITCSMTFQFKQSSKTPQTDHCDCLMSSPIWDWSSISLLYLVFIFLLVSLGFFFHVYWPFLFLFRIFAHILCMFKNKSVKRFWFQFTQVPYTLKSPAHCLYLSQIDLIQCFTSAEYALLFIPSVTFSI